MRVYIDGSDVTSKVERNSIDISQELQQRVDVASFSIIPTTLPTQLQEVKIYEAFTILDVDATTITIDYDYYLNERTGLIRVGDTLWIDINESTELSKNIDSIAPDDNNKITITLSPSGTDGSIGNYAGIKVFAGNIVNISDSNIGTLNDTVFFVECADYTKIFDKELINDTYESRSPRYIINSFCNLFINNNHLIDQMDYDDNASIQTEWSKSANATLATTDTTEPYEADHWGVFPLTTASNQSWSATPQSADVSNYTGLSSGTPTKHSKLVFWISVDDISELSNFRIYYGSDFSNRIKTPTSKITDILTANSVGDGDKFFIELDMVDDFDVDGTPDWTATDYVGFSGLSASSCSVKISGIRIVEEQYFKHFPYIVDSEPATTLDDFRVSRRKPTEIMQRLADIVGYYWFIDYDRYIHFYPTSENRAPFNLTETSSNFSDLQIQYDSSQLMNRVVVYGGKEVSDSLYSQVFEGDSVVREWVMKNDFVNLEVWEDRNDTTSIAGASTNTTTIEITSHGLSQGDYIVNRSRSNAVRKVLTVPSANTITVDSVTGQTSGDTISFFTEKTNGIDGIDTATEASFDYMVNYSARSIRQSTSNTLLDSGDFVLFRYNEKFDIVVQRQSTTSIASVRGILGFTNGIIDGEPIQDPSLQTRAEAISVADAKIRKFSNLILTASFSTKTAGLKTGQIITITNNTVGLRDLNKDFVIQRVRTVQLEEGQNVYYVTCATYLFGMLELLQQLLRMGRRSDVSDTAIIYNVIDADESLVVTDSISWAVDDNKQIETMFMTDSLVSQVIAPPFKYGTGGSPQAYYGLSEYY